jgi:excisionase family DNA binding protein
MGRLFTVKEAALRLRLSVGTVYVLVGRRQLRHVRVGTGRGKIAIPDEAIEEYLKRREVVVSPTAVGGGPGRGAAPVARPKVKFEHLRLRDA